MKYRTLKITQKRARRFSAAARFLVGFKARRRFLALGYSAVPPGLLGGRPSVLPQRAIFDPSVWYSIAPGRNCHSDMRQEPTWVSNIASTMAQIISEETRRELEGHACSARSSTIRSSMTPCSGAQITGGKLEHR